MDEDFLNSGFILKDKYQIIDPIKAGTSGGIYVARDASSDRLVAIKEFSFHSQPMDKTGQIIFAFKREAEILSRLEHPNLPKLIDHFTCGRGCYIVMDYIEGEDLETIIDETFGQGISEEKVLRWSLELCSILEYFHSQSPPVVYGDLKPSNIVMRNSDEKIFLVDFGLARLMSDVRQDEEASGTLGYAPPEQYKGEHDARSDIYSLGATIYHLLTARSPEGPSQFAPIRTINSSISAELEFVLSKTLKIDCTNRYQKIADLKYSLDVIYNKYYRPKIEAKDKLSQDSKEDKIKVFLVDDDKVMRTLFKSIIHRTKDLELLDEAFNGIMALEKFKTLKPSPDVILMDINMPGIDGIETTRLILEYNGDAKIIMLTALSETRIIRKAFMAGAKGYMLKGGSITSVTEGIRKAYRGGLPIDTRISNIIQKKEGNLTEGSFKETLFSTDSPIDLPKYNVINLMTHFYSKKNSGKMFLNNNKENGEIWFNNGRIIHAVLGNLKGENAVYSFLTWTEGKVVFQSGLTSVIETIKTDGQTFISRCLRKNRELARIKLSISSPYEVPVLSSSQEYQVVNLNNEERELLEFIDGKRNIMEISQKQEKSYFDTIKSIHKMMASGLIKKK